MEADIVGYQIAVADVRGHLFHLDIESDRSIGLLYEQGTSLSACIGIAWATHHLNYPFCVSSRGSLGTAEEQYPFILLWRAFAFNRGRSPA